MAGLAKTRALYALERLSPPLRSEVLADGTIAARFGLSLRSPVSLGDKVVERDALFSAFSSLADGKQPAPLVDDDGHSLDAQLSMDADDAATVEINGQRLRFPNAALLASDLVSRSPALQRALARHTLSRTNVEELEKLFSGSPPTHGDFIRGAGILASAPESFVRIFEEKLEKRRGQLGEMDIVPADARHWENLIPLPRTSTTLDAFLIEELAESRAASLKKDMTYGFGILSLSFCAPKLVPSDRLAEESDDALLAMIGNVVGFDDPFALVGAFELCAALYNRDARYAPLGDRLLDRLFGDMEWLRRATGVWATVFVFATAALTRSDETRSQPAYWRRLVAAAHASLIVRICGVRDVDAEGLLGWAVRQRGAEYQLSILRDMHDEPNWRPEWADPSILAADIFGRAYGVVSRLPKDQVPKSWQERIERAKAWIDEHKLVLYSMFPAVLESARRPMPTSLSTLEPNLVSIFQRFIEDPSTEHLLAAGCAAQTFGAPSEIAPALLTAVNAIRDGGESLDERRVQSALSACAHLACFLQDIVVADAVVQTCLNKARTITEPLSVCEALFRVVEVSNANPDRTAGQALLLQGAEALARILPANRLLLELASLLETLIIVDPSLAPVLGRAINTARVAAPQYTM